MSNEHEDEADELDDNFPPEQDTSAARDMSRRFMEYYTSHGDCFAGGPLHIVTDDGNIESEHILFSMECAQRDNDQVAIKICEDLLTMTEGERFYAYMHKYEYANS